jgi:hypothetical protein
MASGYPYHTTSIIKVEGIMDLFNLNPWVQVYINKSDGQPLG